MCLMHTDLPVPEGPRIIEIFPSGIPMFRPRRILLRPKALWTSTDSIASWVPCGRSRCPAWRGEATPSACGARALPGMEGELVVFAFGAGLVDHRDARRIGLAGPVAALVAHLPPGLRAG